MNREQLIDHYLGQFGKMEKYRSTAEQLADMVIAKREEMANPKPPQSATQLHTQPKPKRKTTSKPLAKTEKFHDIRQKLERGSGKLDRNLNRDPEYY